jgi:glycosyltransferase involved in cell wall biosynthesis
VRRRARPPRNVLFVASVWPTLSRFVDPIAGQFEQMGVKTFAAAGGEPPEGLSFRRCDALHEFRRRGAIDVARATVGLARLVRRHDIDLMYLNTPPAVAIGRVVGALMGVPTVAQIHGTFLGAGGLRERVFRIVERSTGRLSAETLVVNDADAAYYRGFLDPETVSMSAGVGVQDQRLREVAERSTHAETGPPIIGVVARLTRDKGLDFVVDVARNVRSRGQDVHLRIIGGAMSGEPLWSAPDEPWIEVTGYLDDPFPAMAECDVMVAGSEREGFSIAVAEALVLGKRVVALDNSGVRQQRGLAGERLIVLPRDVDLFADRVAQLLSQPPLGFQEDLAAAWGIGAYLRFHRDHYLQRLATPAR